MDVVGAAVLGAVLSGTVMAALLGLLTSKLVARLESQVADEFRIIVESRDSQRALLQEVLGPVCAHLQRTSAAFHRWDEKNLSLEARIIAESNRTIRDILLAGFHLLPPDLRTPAMQLVEHFDRWLEEFEVQRGQQNPDSENVDFVFVGPKGFPFPKDAERQFEEALDKTYGKLVGAQARA